MTPASAAPLPEDWASTAAPYVRREDSPGSGSFHGISLAGIHAIAGLTGTPLAEIMALCLDHGVWPLRFKNNRGVYDHAEQAALLRSRAAIIGCGGLGGHAASLLARMGVGALTLCDCDRFDESNLNRQAFCREDRLGAFKALAVEEELRLTASHMDIRAFPQKADASSLPRILQDAHIALDCLDDIGVRRLVEKTAHDMGIPFVHGTIAGLEGFAMASFPGDSGIIPNLYGPRDIPKSETAERRMGVPGPTPMATAVMQSLLAVRILTGNRNKADGMLWHLDLSAPELELLRP